MYDIETIVDEIMKKNDITPSDVPKIDLYMDQVLSLFDEFFPYNDQESEITKTMINNYTKNGIIKPAIKKKYDREHIFMMIVVCMLKRSLSLGEIKTLIDGVKLDEDMESDNKSKPSREKIKKDEKKISNAEKQVRVDQKLVIEDIYEHFLENKTGMNERVKSELGRIMAGSYDKEMTPYKKMLDVLFLSYYSNLLSEVARAIIKSED